MCNNPEKGAVARKKCSNACIKCKKCEKACPLGAIKVDDIAVIDYSICEGCGTCIDVCPVGCISKLDLTGKHNVD
jgi:ferredoxin